MGQICQALNFSNLENFGDSWGERFILEGWSWISMLFKMTFLITFISIIKLYNKIWQNYIQQPEDKKTWFYIVFNLKLSFLKNNWRHKMDKKIHLTWWGTPTELVGIGIFDGALICENDLGGGLWVLGRKDT